MKILAIETSCDETAVAVVENGTKILASSIASSMEVHAGTGGIIPENAARKQIEYILPTLKNCIEKAGFDSTDSFFQSIDAIAVTVGPGLIGSLLVGVETAKTLAWLYKKPIIPVNHVFAHQYANWINKREDEMPQFPILSLIVSGGHTDLLLLKSHTNFEYLGGTRDDAAGEAFDKCARLLSLPYPGGPSIASAAEEFIKTNPSKEFNLFPRGMAHQNTLDMSFSGLKTSVLRYIEKNKLENKNELAAEVQEAIIDSLIEKIELSMSQFHPISLLLSGGVSANKRLHLKIREKFAKRSNTLKIFMPDFLLATDNAVMVGSMAYFHQSPLSVFKIEARPSLNTTEVDLK